MKILMSSTAVGLALASATPVFAQTAESSGGTNVEEVVVTAQRRAERLQDVPMSVAAITSETLAKSGITSSADIARVTPSVEMPFYGLFLQPAIRGVSSTGANLGDNSNVAMYIDGVYQPQQMSTLIDLPDVQQIEVLKGPQGALYGQNATGGAILVTSQAPSFTFGGKLSASYGNYNAKLLRGYVTGPLGDKVAVSLGGGFQDRNGFLKHVVTGQRDRGLNSKVIRGKVLFRPIDEATITLTAYHTDRNDSATNTDIAFNNSSLGYLVVPTAPKVQPGTGKFVGITNGFTHIKGDGVSIKGEFDVGAGTITSISAYTKNKTKYLTGIDYAVDLAEASTNGLFAKYFVHETNFVSRKFGQVSFLAGVFYLKGRETFNTSDFRTRVPSVPPAAAGATTFLLQQYGRLPKEVIAGYADLTFDVTDQLVVTAGGRYTRETQRGFSGFLPGPISERPGGSYTSSKFTPRVTARYALTPSSNLYASWGQGFKSSLINTANLAQAPVSPEVITAYEVGYKGRVTSDLSVNVAAFLYNYKDLQVVAYTPPVYLNQNAASARIKGVDIDFSWVVLPELTLSGGVGLLDAKYRSFPAAAVFVSNGFGNDQVTRDLSGKRMLRAPKLTASLAADYHVDTEMGRFAAYGSVYHNSGFGFEVSNTFTSGSYTTIDGELSFSPTAAPGLRLIVWGKNLTDKNYFISFLASQFSTGMGQSEPRTFGVRAEYSF